MMKAIRIAIAAAFGVAAAMPALAQDVRQPAPGTGHPGIVQHQSGMSSDHDRYYRGNVDMSMANGSNEFGSPAGDMPTDREIRLGSNGGSVNVNHGETVKFVLPGGREFRWRFDTLANVTSFPLSSIAPDNLSGRVYVSGDNPNNLG